MTHAPPKSRNIFLLFAHHRSTGSRTIEIGMALPGPPWARRLGPGHAPHGQRAPGAGGRARGAGGLTIDVIFGGTGERVYCILGSIVFVRACYHYQRASIGGSPRDIHNCTRLLDVWTWDRLNTTLAL